MDSMTDAQMYQLAYRTRQQTNKMLAREARKIKFLSGSSGK